MFRVDAGANIHSNYTTQQSDVHDPSQPNIRLYVDMNDVSTPGTQMTLVWDGHPPILWVKAAKTKVAIRLQVY